MNGPVHPDIAAALEQAGWRARACYCISNLRAPEIGRRTYRVELESGLCVKARRLEDEETARRLLELRRHLPEAFAPALSQFGPVVLEEWVEGEGLGEDVPAALYLVQAARLLAQLHAQREIAGQAVREAHETGADREVGRQNLRQLATAGALAQADAQRLSEALQRLDPRRATYGLVHLDFCGENMLIDKARRLRVIDNERIGIGALGFDWGRTWYRWDLPSAAWERFRSAYLACAPTPEPVETLGFWSIIAVVNSAALRLRTAPERVHVPLRRLERMLRALASSGGGPLEVW